MTLGRLAVLAALAMFWASTAMGQGYPNRAIHVVVPFTAGSATDILARTYGQKLSEMWSQPVVVDNRPGAGGTIGAAVVAKSAPDGYTLLVHSAAQAYNPSIYPSLPYDTVKDFIDIVPLGGQPNVLVVAPASGIKTVADLIAQAKQKPGQLNFGSAGTGSGTHINGEKFKLAAGIDVVHIPYKGTPEALTDIIAGRVTYFFSCATASSSRWRSAPPSARARFPAFRRLPRRGCRDSTIRCGSACLRRQAHRPRWSTRSRETSAPLHNPRT